MASAHHLRQGTVIGLLVANVGAAIPFGLESGGFDNHVDPLEWVLSVVFALAAIALVGCMLGLISWPFDGWALILTAGAWSATAFYAGFLTGFTVRARLGEGLIFLALAIVAVAAYLSERRDA